MARTLTSEPVFFSAVPNILTFSGLKIGSKGTYVMAAVCQHDTTVYEETTYYYANAAGQVIFDVSPFLTRAFDKLFKNPDVTPGEGGINSYRTFLYNLLELSIEATVTDAIDGQTYTDQYESMYVSYGGVALNEITKWRKELDLKGSIVTATRMLTRATYFELNGYLPATFHMRVNPLDAAGIVFGLYNAKTGAYMGSYPIGTGGAYAISAMVANIATVKNVKWLRMGANQAKQVYSIKINNDAAILDKIKAGTCVYLRWLNSLGGFSYGLFKVKAEGRAIASEVIGKQYSTIVPEGLVNQKDFQIMAKRATKSLSIGMGQVGWDRMYDLLDLLTSIDVCVYSIYEAGDIDRTNNWTPVLVSGNASPRRDYNYNDFSCEITFPELFTQKR